MVLQDNIPLEKPTAVQLKTILNHVERHKSFVYQDARWADPATKTQIAQNWNQTPSILAVSG